MRTVGVATFARSDYSTCLPLLKAIQADPELRLHLIVSGAHLSARFGTTLDEIQADGFVPAERIEMPLDSDSVEAGVRAVGVALAGFSQSFERFRPDLLLFVGDRFELFSAACAGLYFKIPMAHVSGGDVTEGAIDNQVRFALTKMSHLHFVAMEAHARRIIRAGEEPWRVFVTGDPALDSVGTVERLDRAGLSAELGLELRPPVAVVSYHPTSLGSVSPGEEIRRVLGALESFEGTMLFTYPSADANSDVILREIQRFVQPRPRARLFASLGQRRFYSLLALADLILGNSSSGLWEAPSFGLPAVNVGDRQRGRTAARNVIQAPPDTALIRAALDRALDPEFRNSLRGLVNPYGDGHAAPRILQALKSVDLGPRLLQKPFHE